ncbi:MAG: IMP cyclohydrolase [Clostridia bacterium]|nr:IMP cyclohydrolase [Clostridia bacterium]
MADVYACGDVKTVLSGNVYPGRGIMIGKTPDGRKALTVYFIMGRSENSRNRVFREQPNGDLIIYPFDESKVKDPSLIIYSPVRSYGNRLIVTNGDQTDTVYEYLAKNQSFEDALATRCFEPDGPNFTPRISGMLNFGGGDFTYEMSILKSADAQGSACNRFHFSYAAVPGVLHFIHTYLGDGNPIPTFCGEPERLACPDASDAAQIAKMVWDALNADNKVALEVRLIDLESGKTDKAIINRHGG